MGEGDMNYHVPPVNLLPPGPAGKKAELVAGGEGVGL